MTASGPPAGPRVVVDTASAVPVYEQLRQQVATLVTTGALQAGDRLPAARVLAADLGIALGTVQRAYRELEGAGIVTARRRFGTVVAGTGVVVDDAVRRAALRFAERALRSGLAPDQVIDLVRGAVASTSSTPPPAGADTARAVAVERRAALGGRPSPGPATAPGLPAG